jgi:hypothetical protein
MAQGIRQALPCIVTGAMTVWRDEKGRPCRPGFGGIVDALTGVRCDPPAPPAVAAPAASRSKPPAKPRARKKR